VTYEFEVKATSCLSARSMNQTVVFTSNSLQEAVNMHFGN